MAGGSNPQNVQTPKAGGPSASEGRFYSLPPGWQGVREGTPDARRPMPGGGPMPPGLNQTMPAPMPGGGGLPPGLNRTMPAPMPGGSQPSSTPAPATAPTTGAPNIYQQSSNAYTQALQGTAAAGAYQPQNVQAGTAAGGINTYMNPYTQQVIDTSMADLERQRQMQQNQLGAQASSAGAFGGSRQGIAEAETNRAFAQQGGQLAAQLRQQGFNTALGASQQDVANQMQAALANQGAGFQAANLGLNAASQLGNLSQQGFNMGQTIGNQQWQQGQAQQGINQQLINDIRNQYSGFTGSPAAGLGIYQGGLGAANMGQQTQTTSENKGIFDYITAIASIPGICWVAREVYGPEDDRWMEFRAWLLGAAPDWLFNAYAKHGEAFAGVVRKVPALKRVLRPLMDRARRSAGFEV